jgi:dipeptidyl aminopeptidase/acylaminoacyl peptidase
MLLPSAQASATFDSFQLDVKSGAVHRLTRGPGDDLSPDRTSAVYRTGGKLLVARLDGSDNRMIVNVPYQIPSVAWSPSGKLIAFEIEDSTSCASEPPPCGRRAIWLVNVDGSGLREFADNASDPAWSPDSRSLAFISHFVTHTFTGNIAIENVDGTGFRMLTAREEPEQLRWSPGGHWISYAQVRRAGHRDVVRVIAVARRRRTRTIGRGDFPFWLGGRVAFIRFVPTNRRALYVASIGARPRRILTTDDIHAPSPSPDARRIAYASGYSLVVVTDKGRSVRIVSLGRGVVFGPIFWSRDGESLFYTRMVNGCCARERRSR